MTDKKELLEKYQIVGKELSDLRTKETVMRHDLELLNLLGTSEFLAVNPAVSYIGLTEVISRNITEEVQRTLAQSNAHIQEFIKSLITKWNNDFKALARKIAEKKMMQTIKKERKYLMRTNICLMSWNKYPLFQSKCS